MPRNIGRSFNRRPSERVPQRQFHLFCEGKNTEPDYFKTLGIWINRLLVDNRGTVKIKIHSGAGDPLKIAGKAVQLSKDLAEEKRKSGAGNSYEKRDQVWTVFDRDEHPGFHDAVIACESNNVAVARSNPCFEIWLILHCEDFHKPDGRQAVQKHLQKLRPEYDPNGSKSVDAAALIKAIDRAEIWAENGLQSRSTDGSPFGPPSTTVHRLTRQIRGTSP